MYGLTHAAFALALTYVLKLPVATGMLASLLPDTDAMFAWEFPFSHRGILHTPLAAIVVGALVFTLTDSRSTSYAATLGFASHLFLDTMTHSGIMWLFPWEGYLSWNLAAASSLQVNLAITLFSLLAFVAYRNRTRLIRWRRLIAGRL
jgi:membrane-bound metal-dependent hydrolase YbcI (DUF457 family)